MAENLICYCCYAFMFFSDAIAVF